MSGQKEYRPMTDAMGCFFNLYLTLGMLTGTATYFLVAIDLAVKGQWLQFFIWLVIIGPLVDALITVTWPIALWLWLSNA